MHTPTFDDDVKKKGMANQVSTPAAMFPVVLPHDGSEKLFNSDSDEDDVIDITSSTDKESSQTSVFTLDKSIQHIKDCNMVHSSLYQDAVMNGGQEIFQINNKVKHNSAIEKSVLKTHEHLLELQQLHKDAFRDNRDSEEPSIDSEEFDEPYGKYEHHWSIDINKRMIRDWITAISSCGIFLSWV